MTRPTNTETRLKWRSRALVALRLFLAVIFTASGTAKMFYAPLMVLVFAATGLGREVMVLIALIELVGAALILVPGTVVLGACLVSAIAWGAVYMHLVLIGGTAVPAFVLALLAGLIIWERVQRDDAAA